MALDPATWTAGGVAAGEAVVIAALVVRRRRHTEQGRRLYVAVRYHGPDTTDDTSTREAGPDAPPTI